MSNRHRLHRNGFTLIELLVTISIISLLIALLLPVMAKARTVASTALCLSNQRSIFQASAMFVPDHRGYYPITTTSFAAFYGGSTGNPIGYYHYGRHLDKGGYFQMDNGVRPGLLNPAARCPERRSNYATTFGLPEYTGVGADGTMDYITSTLTGTPRSQTTMQAWDPWTSPVNNTFWTVPRNNLNGPAPNSDLGRYGPYLADDIPPRKILLADAPINSYGFPLILYPKTLSVGGGWYDIPGGMTMLTSGGAGATVIEDNLTFPLHNGGFNGMFFDGSGKFISGSIATPTTTTLTLGSPTPSYKLWNLFRWTPQGPTNSGNAGYAPLAAFPAGFPANSGF